jgi:hypothetical protein
MDQLRAENISLRNEIAQARAQLRAFENSRATVRSVNPGGGRNGSMSVRLTGPELPARDKQREDQFLADNKARRDIVTLASGLQYRIISPGFGRSPRENEIVSLNYRGTLIDGTEIDSSFTRGEPAEFSMSSIMKGWKEALLLMPAGAKWQLFVPSELAYGERGLSRRIPGNATLLYELELVSIRDRNTPTSPAAFTTDFVQPGGFE